MNMRRMLSWWLRIVLSGRFLERFLRVPKTADETCPGDKRI